MKLELLAALLSPFARHRDGCPPPHRRQSEQHVPYRQCLAEWQKGHDESKYSHEIDKSENIHMAPNWCDNKRTVALADLCGSIVLVAITWISRSSTTAAGVLFAPLPSIAPGVGAMFHRTHWQLLGRLPEPWR
jgi:hypothetical protein